MKTFIISSILGLCFAPFAIFAENEAFFWNKAASGPWQWEDPANWLDGNGAPAVTFPNAPGNVAIITNLSENITQTICISRDITIGELHLGKDALYSTVVFTGMVASAGFVFDNGDSPALLTHRNAYSSPRFHTDWTIPNGLTVSNDSSSVFIELFGKITGAKPDLAIAKNRLRWTPPENTAYAGALSTSGSGLFAKDGAFDLTFLGGGGRTHSARFGSMYSEGDSGGLYGSGALKIAGGVFENANNGVNYLFANRDGTFILSDGARYVPTDTTRLGRVDRNSIDSKVVVNGGGTVWDGKKPLIVSKSGFFVRDGARAELGTTQVQDGGIIEITGADPQTGAPALLDLNGNNLWVAYSGYDTPSNRVIVGAAGVLTNGAVLVRGEYSGSTNSFIEVSDGGRVYATLAVGQGGNQAGDAVENYALITGEGTVWAYPSAGTVKIGERANGKADIGNYVKVEKGAVFTNAAFNVGFSDYYVNNVRSVGNHLDIVDGGKVFSTLDSGIGLSLSYSPNNCGVEGNYALVAGGENGDSFWDIGGNTLRIGASNGYGAKSAGNYLEVRAGGSVTNVAALEIGSSDLNSNSDNFIRLAGGKVTAETLRVKTNNGIEAHIGTNGVNKIIIAGDAVFSPDTFIRPIASSGAPVGEYEILTAGKIIDKGLRIAPDADQSAWQLKIKDNSVRVFRRKSNTVTYAR